MSLINLFTEVTTDSYLAKIKKNKLNPEIIFSKFQTQKINYRAAILDILNKNDINKLPIDEFKILIKLIKKLTDTVQHIGLLKLNTKNKLYCEIRKLVIQDRKILLKGVLTLTTSELAIRTKQQQNNLKRDNKNQTTLANVTIKKMISHLVAIEPKKLSHKIILAQISLGTRLIEILNKNVSVFKIDPNNSTNIIQTGVAKSTDERQISKPTIVISPMDFMNLMVEIRQITDADSTKNNVYINNKYNARVNDEIRRIFLKFKIPKKLQSSHGLRKIWVNYSYCYHAPQGMSLTSWITDMLGHKDGILSTAANHYSTVHIKTVAEPVVETVVEPVVEKTVKQMNLAEKYEYIERLVARGFSSYTEFQRLGITTYMLSKYKRSKGITGPL
tara:strand:- start:16 stop:1179 length:1164 start_codon:yes stop_codon:yes gene_type:complete